eukprot:PhF_6_TR40164/c2_g2_i2/m.59475/K07910/RAB18; Ras-related protein Rab-18
MSVPERPQCIKIATLGKYNVGKTSLLWRYEDDTFRHDLHSVHHGWCEFKIKRLNRTTLLPPKDLADVDKYPKEHVKVFLWDTAGQERFRTFTTSYCRVMHIILLCFDVSDPETFSQETMKRYIFDALSCHRAQPYVVAFVGNKIDKLAAEGKDWDSVDIPCPISLVPPNMHVVVPLDDGGGPRYQHGEYHNRLRVCFYALH